MVHWGLMITEVKSGCYLHCRAKAMCQIRATRSPTSKYWSGTLHASRIFSRVYHSVSETSISEVGIQSTSTFDVRSCLFFLWHLHSVHAIRSEINWPNKKDAALSKYFQPAEVNHSLKSTLTNIDTHDRSPPVFAHQWNHRWVPASL